MQDQYLISLPNFQFLDLILLQKKYSASKQVKPWLTDVNDLDNNKALRIFLLKGSLHINQVQITIRFQKL